MGDRPLPNSYLLANNFLRQAASHFFAFFSHDPFLRLGLPKQTSYERRVPFEHHRQPLAPHHVFVRRVLLHFSMAVGLICLSLGIGIVGYHTLGGLAWEDALVESSMLMGGQGPVYGQNLTTVSAKIFSSAYALFCGVVLIALFGIILSPVLHRILHRLHVSEK